MTSGLNSANSCGKNLCYYKRVKLNHYSSHLRHSSFYYEKYHSKATKNMRRKTTKKTEEKT